MLVLALILVPVLADSTLEAAWIGFLAVIIAATFPAIIAAWRVGPRLGHGSITDQIERVEQATYYDRGLLHAIALELGIDPDRPETWPTNRRRRR